MTLSERERRVLTELEAQLSAVDSSRWAAIARVARRHRARAAILVLVTSACALLAVFADTPAIAAVLGGLCGFVGGLLWGPVGWSVVHAWRKARNTAPPSART
jgi:hypothetical protein